MSTDEYDDTVHSIESSGKNKEQKASFRLKAVTIRREGYCGPAQPPWCETKLQRNFPTFAPRALPPLPLPLCLPSRERGRFSTFTIGTSSFVLNKGKNVESYSKNKQRFQATSFHTRTRKASHRVAYRWQLDSRTERYLRCFLAKVTW